MSFGGVRNPEALTKDPNPELETTRRRQPRGQI
jgi:hypothetical protein